MLRRPWILKVSLYDTWGMMLLILERDLRVLIRGIQKWGDIRARYDQIVRLDV
jgi:hypothetical protein